MTDRDWMTIVEVSEALRLSKMTVYRLIERGELPAYKFGRTFRIDRDDFEDWVEEQKNV